jgi:hypothetical protein
VFVRHWVLFGIEEFPKPGSLPLAVSVVAMLAALLGQRSEPLRIRSRLLGITCGIGLTTLGMSKMSQINNVLAKMESAARSYGISIERGLYVMIAAGVLLALIGIFSLPPRDPVNPNQDW